MLDAAVLHESNKPPEGQVDVLQVFRVHHLLEYLSLVAQRFAKVLQYFVGGQNEQHLLLRFFVDFHDSEAVLALRLVQPDRVYLERTFLTVLQVCLLGLNHLSSVDLAFVHDLGPSDFDEALIFEVVGNVGQPLGALDGDLIGVYFIAHHILMIESCDFEISVVEELSEGVGARGAQLVRVDGLLPGRNLEDWQLLNLP